MSQLPGEYGSSSVPVAWLSVTEDAINILNKLFQCPQSWFYFYKCLCVFGRGVGAVTSIMASMWKSEDNFVESIPSFYLHVRCIPSFQHKLPGFCARLFPHRPSTLSFEIGPLTESAARQFSEAIWPARSRELPFSVPLAPGLLAHAATPGFLYACKGSKHGSPCLQSKYFINGTILQDSFNLIFFWRRSCYKPQDGL